MILHPLYDSVLCLGSGHVQALDAHKGRCTRAAQSSQFPANSPEGKAVGPDQRELGRLGEQGMTVPNGLVRSEREAPQLFRVA